LSAATSKTSGYGLALEQMKELADGMANAVHAVGASNVAASVEQTTSDTATWAIITNLTTQLSALTKQNAEMAKQNAKIMAKLNLPPTNFTNVPGPDRVQRMPIDEGGYCHSHGYLVIPKHTSANCKWPKEGHQVTATRANNMGGNQRGKPAV
jgi:hypothetical protein